MEALWKVESGSFGGGGMLCIGFLESAGWNFNRLYKALYGSIRLYKALQGSIRLYKDL